jgi:hypothetical protein
VAETSAADPADEGDLLAIGGKLAALVAVLLPVAGFVVRYVAFSLNSTTAGVAEVLAWSAPIAQLAATGVLSIGLGLVVVVIAGLSDYIERLPGPSRAHVSLYAAGTATVVAVLLVLWPWTWALSVGLGCSIGGGLGLWDRRLRGRDRHLTFRHGWWLAAPIILAGAVSYGLGSNPDGITLADYTFAGSAHLQDGTFAQLGESGTTVYVQRCLGSSAIDAVNIDQVLLRTGITSSDRRSPPSVLSMIFAHEPPGAGYRPPC